MPELQTNMPEIRLQQARRLREGAKSSALMVSGVILYIFALLILTDELAAGIIWVALTLTMVSATLLYARFGVQGHINRSNYRRYLNGHILITMVTGSVWAGFAIYHMDYDSYASLFVAGSAASAITLGGMFIGSDYRPAYIALAVTTLMPIAVYLTLTAPESLRFMSLGVTLYFLFGLLTSARAELNSRDGIIARAQKALAHEAEERVRISREIFREKAQFLAATSHDLSQPLHAQGYFLEALGHLVDRPDQRALLDRLKASWSAQKKMLDDLVSATRLEGGITDPTYEIFDIAALIREVSDELTANENQRSVAVQLNLTSQLIHSDRTFCRRIVSNILSNAIKFSPDGSSVVVQSKKLKDSISITIRDHGPGIPAELRGDVFKEFVQLEENAAFGLGLGLSIVGRLADRIGASVELGTPTEGSGLEAHIRIPFEQAKNDAPLMQAAQIDDSLFVAILDNETDIREAMVAVLTNWGIQVVATPTIESLLSILLAHGRTPDLFLVDYQLEGGRMGTDAIISLRETLNDTVPAVIMTGNLKSPLTETPFEKTQIVAKPVAPETLRNLLSLK